VEDYTLACGTGSGSLAALLWKTGQITDSLTAENPGGTLHLNISGTVSIHALHLEGPTEIIAQISL
jgi:diaminopimelate epimerase